MLDDSLTPYPVHAKGVNGVFCVVRSECNGIARGFTYELNSDRPIFRGEGINYHPAEYEHMKRQVPFFAVGGGSLSDDDNRDDCTFHLEIYPSLDFISSYDSPVNIIATATVIAFAIVALSFHIYDFVVNARNRKVEETAARSEAVVSSLFPEHVRDRVMMGKKKRIERPWWTTNDPSSSDGESDDGDRVIADFYPAATILFAGMCLLYNWLLVYDSLSPSSHLPLGFSIALFFSRVLCLPNRYCWIHSLVFNPRAKTCFHSVGDFVFEFVSNRYARVSSM